MSELRRDLSQIQTAIRTSPIGDQLNQIERWQRFRTSEDRTLWLQLLGPTAVVLSHQEHFLEFVFTWVKNLPEAEFRMLLLGTSVHDLGEAKLGDIASPDKTLGDEAQEVDFALEAILTLPLEHPLIQELVEAYNKIVRGDDTVLHLIFRSLEKTEYLDTAVTVFDSINSGLEMEKAPILISRVLALDLPKIINYAQLLPHIVGEYLLAHIAQIDEMFEQFEPAVTKDIEDAFIVSRSIWRDFKNS